MPYQELPGLGMRGLNTDTPAQALDHTHFSAGNNMRPFDGSLQTVYTHGDVNSNITPSDQTDVYGFTSWVTTGETRVRAAYFFRDTNDKLLIQVVNDVTGSGADVLGGVTATGPDIDDDNPDRQLFAFNGVLIANTGADGGFESFTIGTGDMDIPAVDSPGAAWPAATVSTVRVIPFGVRLVALNLAGYVDDDLGNSSILWSETIQNINTITGMSFVPTSTNTAGDDILTETPGIVLDGGTLGQYLIIYKSDAVYRYADVGEPLYLVGEPLFTDDGVYGPDCFADIGGGRHLVLGNFGVYIHDGGPNRQNISRGRVQEDLYSDLTSSSYQPFLFHHTNDREVWIAVTGTKAYVYNYDLDAWHTRTLPSMTRGMHSVIVDGELHIWMYGDYGVRPISTDYMEGDAEIHYMSFGDPSMVKHTHAVYPHSMEKVGIDIATSNNLGLNQAPDFDGDPNVMVFDASSESDYKLDYRVHGRYYHIRIESVDDSGVINPQITGLGIDMKVGGDR